MEKRIEILSKIENISLVEKLIDEISDENNISSEIYGKVLIASVEAVNNSIKHGNKEDESKKVVITVAVKDKKIRVKVCDEGSGFNYQDVPDPTLPENIENIHGRGVFLMKHLADDLKYFKEGACVEIIFNNI